MHVHVCIRYTVGGSLVPRPPPSFSLLKGPLLLFLGRGDLGTSMCIVLTERSEKEDSKEISDWLHNSLHLLGNKKTTKQKCSQLRLVNKTFARQQASVSGTTPPSPLTVTPEGISPLM